MNVGGVAPGAEEIVRPRLHLGASGRPNNFTVSHHGTTGSRFTDRGLRCESGKTVAQSHIQMGAGGEERYGRAKAGQSVPPAASRHT